jgi:CheR methyltransferase, SAM binding domain
MDVLIGKLTIGETSFFREPDQFAAIRDIVLPHILERKQESRQLRIWSAGCATGCRGAILRQRFENPGGHRGSNPSERSGPRESRKFKGIMSGKS